MMYLRRGDWVFDKYGTIRPFEYVQLVRKSITPGFFKPFLEAVE